MQNPEVANMIEQLQDGTVNQYPTKKETEKPKSQPSKSSYKRKWITPKEVAEIKGISPTWANQLMKEGFFGKNMGKEHSREGYVTRKVLREVVENTKLVGKGQTYASQQNLKPFNKKQETQAEQEAFNYEDFKKQIMEDHKFLLALSREVMRNLKFVTKLES